MDLEKYHMALGALTGLSTDYGRTAFDSLAKVADASKFSGLLMDNSTQGWINDLARPSLGLGALTGLSTDYGRTAFDSLAKSLADTSKFSGLLGLENSWQERLNELTRPSVALGALTALSTDYLGLDTVTKSLADTSKFSGLLGLENSWQERLNELTRPSVALGALTALSTDYLGLNTVAKSVAGASKLTGLLGLENSTLGRINDLARPSLGLGALTGVSTEYERAYSAFDSMVNSAVTKVGGLTALHSENFFAHQFFPQADSRQVMSLSTSQPEESIRQDWREHDPFIEVLKCLDPAFTRLWIGAFVALQSNNPDRVRHVAVSLRELLTHVMHFMAPDRDVQVWIRNPEKQTKDGRPTRLTRLHFVVAPGADSLAEEDADQLDDILLHFRELQDRTHRLENAAGQSEMKELLSKTEKFISMLAARHLAKKKLH